MRRYNDRSAPDSLSMFELIISSQMTPSSMATHLIRNSPPSTTTLCWLPDAFWLTQTPPAKTSCCLYLKKNSVECVLLVQRQSKPRARVTRRLVKAFLWVYQRLTHSPSDKPGSSGQTWLTKSSCVEINLIPCTGHFLCPHHAEAQLLWDSLSNLERGNKDTESYFGSVLTGSITWMEESSSSCV